MYVGFFCPWTRLRFVKMFRRSMHIIVPIVIILMGIDLSEVHFKEVIKQFNINYKCTQNYRKNKNFNKH